MRKGLALSAVLAGLLLAGCSGGAAPAPASSQEPSAPATTKSPYPPRTAPAKSVDVADQCSLVSPQQQGADKATPRTSNGKAGCEYGQGAGGDGFLVFVSATKVDTMQKWADLRKSKIQVTDVGGYPAAQGAGGNTNCAMSVDVSDQGSLFVNTLVPHGDKNPCDLSKQFAEAALQNLPNA